MKRENTTKSATSDVLKYPIYLAYQATKKMSLELSTISPPKYF